MTQQLDLADIQGNILQDFVSGYPIARFVLLNVTEAKKGRAFVMHYRSRVTTALRWSHSNAYVGEVRAIKPQVAINLGISYRGFAALGLPTRTLSRLPPEFIDGMRNRAEILGGMEEKDSLHLWDRAWSDDVHLLVGLNALLDPVTGEGVAALSAETNHLQELCARFGIRIVTGHGKSGGLWQDSSAILTRNRATYKPVPVEHFGFIDGISNPVFEGQFGDPQADAIMAIGCGKILEAGSPKSGDNRWAPLATGEFLLGHPDEAQETAETAAPLEIMRNGTFLVYRKLHENVGQFRAFLTAAATRYARTLGISPEDAEELLKAKMAGRWSDGVPISAAPTL